MSQLEEQAKRLARALAQKPANADNLKRYEELTPEERERLVPGDAEQIEVVSGGRVTPEK